MRLFHQMLVTVDGFIAGPNGELDWHAVDDDFSDYVSRMLRSIDGIILGRNTYEGLAQYWPTATEPEAPMMNGLPKYVVSNTLTTATWHNTTIVSGDATEEVARLKDRPGRDLGLFASARLSVPLMAAGLIDEYRVLVCPVLLGAGVPLHPGLTRRVPLQLTHSERFASGTIYNAYEPL